MTVKLLHFTPYEVMIRAARISHDSNNRLDTKGNSLGPNDLKLLKQLIALEHFSVLEHIVYAFEISGVSRALLQELARHRHISMTVQSTRFALKKILKNGYPIVENVGLSDEDTKMIFKMINWVKEKIKSGAKNDVVKYLLPEAFATKLVLTVNARELAHIINLRIRPNALPEFQMLAQKLLEEVKIIHPELWELLEKKFQWNQC